MHEFETALRLFLAGHTSIVETKAALLKGFPGPRAPHEALLLADFVEDVALSVRAGRAGVAEAVSDLVHVRAAECGGCVAGTVH
jgi:hypothetical protein